MRSGGFWKAKWEDFIADFEGNPDPARAWNLIKSFTGFPHFTHFAKSYSTMAAHF